MYEANEAPRDGQSWTRQELTLAFGLYCQLPFGKIHARNPKVIELAQLLGRTPGSVSYKLTNFARLDPVLQARGVRGNTHGSKGEEDIWKEFADDPERLAFRCAELMAQYTGTTVEQVAEIDLSDLSVSGIEREAIVRVRVNQSFFRKRILSAYEYKCCVTGINVPELLVASHIVAWSADAANRMNPRNGLCLNALHDRAFDRGLMWIDEELVIRFSPKLLRSSQASGWLTSFNGKSLLVPSQFKPDINLLRRHAENCRDAPVN